MAAQPDSESQEEPGVAVLDLTEIDGLPVSDAELALIVGGRPPSWRFDDDGSEPWNKKTMPIQNGGRVSSPTGKRPAPGGGTQDHTGTDFPAPAGTPIVARKSGIVESSYVNPDWGGVIVVRNLDGSQSQYIHVVREVSGGQYVSVGSKIGAVGRAFVSNEGGVEPFTTGDHLHYGERDPQRRVVPTSRLWDD